MTADALLVVQFLFTSIWSFFTSWYIPGTNVTPAAMFFFIMAVTVVFRILKRYFLGGDGDGD